MRSAPAGPAGRRPRLRRRRLWPNISTIISIINITSGIITTFS